MSWQHRADLGTELVAYVHDALRVQEQWRIDIGRGFTWWASDFAQSVWADPGVFHNTSSVFRLHAEIELLKGSGHAEQCEIFLSSFMANTTLSALVYDGERDTFKLHCSVYADNDNAEWLKRLFLGAVGLQLCEAHKKSKWLADTLDTAPATSAHPTSGMRNDPDQMVNAVDQFFRPMGQQPSKWQASDEWDEACDILKRFSTKCTGDDQSYLIAHMPWGGRSSNPLEQQTSILEINGEKPHPDLGNGLHLSLTVPLQMDQKAAAHAALELNEIERREWRWYHDLGSWASQGGTLIFECFIPNTSYVPRALVELSQGMARRAQWVDEHFQLGSYSAAG
jgi:hypothetical protein